MDQHCGQLSSRILESMDIDGLTGLDRHMTVDESMDSEIGFTYFFRESFKEWFRDKGVLS
jgi:hypothetical protein